MALYESVPSTIEAVQWTGDNFHHLQAVFGIKVECHYHGSHDGQLKLLAGKDGSQEWVPVPVGHWLVCQPNDLTDIWPVAPAYFDGKYRPAGGISGRSIRDDE